MKNLILHFNFLASLIGSLGSLFFSEILKYPPCVLCWYQRICLYPLVVIFGVALWTEDLAYKKYAYPFVVLGLTIAVYHNLIYYDFISAALTPCAQGASCSTRQLELFGFITIPLLSLLGFLTTFGLLFLDKHSRARS